MSNPLTKKSWSPYVVGASIGVLSWLTFATANKPIGITTAFEYTAALTEQAAAPQVAQPYLEAKAKDNKSPKIDWEWMLVVGVFVGAYLSSKMSGDRAPEEKVPPLWLAIRRFAGGALRRRVSGRARDDARRAHRAGLHEWTCHQRRAATRAGELDLCARHVRRGHRRGVPHLRKGGPQPCLMNRSNLCSVW